MLSLIKKDIEIVDLQTALNFVKNIDVKSFKLISDNVTQYGFIAQDLIKLNDKRLDPLIGNVEDKEMLEHTDEDGLTSPAGSHLIVAYQQAACLTQIVVKDLLKRIDKLESLLTTVLDLKKKDKTS